MSQMEIERVLFERGIDAVRAYDGKWRIQAVLKGQDDAFPSPASITAQFGVRPVVVFQRRTVGPPLGLLLQTDARLPPLNLVLSDIMQSATRGGEHAFYDFMLLQYLAGAVVYHCTELAYKHAEVCRQYTTFFGRLERQSDFSLFGYQAEAYYDFDGLITATRRAYDALRGPLWKSCGCRGSLPRSLPSLLKSPHIGASALKDTVRKSWEDVGVEVASYRDCLLHYTSTDFAMSSASMQVVDDRIVTARFRIPDNPDARSQKAFVFKGDRDALQFGWKVATEIVSLYAKVTETIATTPTKPTS